MTNFGINERRKMALNGVLIRQSMGNGYGIVKLCPDSLIICPLDDTHIITLENLESHVERCLIGDLIEMTCPWNAHHVVDETSYENHVNFCEDKPTEMDSERSLEH